MVIITSSLGRGAAQKGAGLGGGGGAGTETDLVCVVAPTPGQKVLAKHQTAPCQAGTVLLPQG